MFVEACKTNKNIKIAIIDHISSCSAIKFPVKKIIEALKPFNILILIDGAHAPGQIPSLDLGTVRFIERCNFFFSEPDLESYAYMKITALDINFSNSYRFKGKSA